MNEANAGTITFGGLAFAEALKALGIIASSTMASTVGLMAILLQGDSSPIRPTNETSPNNSNNYKTGTEQPWQEPGQTNHGAPPPNWYGAGKFIIGILTGSVTLKYCSDNTKVKIPYRLDYNASDSTYIK